MEIERHLLVMLGLYEAMLGDTFVREAIPSTIRAARIAEINGKKSGYIYDVVHGSTKGGLTLWLGLQFLHFLIYTYRKVHKDHNFPIFHGKYTPDLEMPLKGLNRRRPPSSTVARKIDYQYY